MPRFIEVKNGKGEWMVVDTKSIPHKVLCICSGYDAPFSCEQIIEALEGFHTTLYSKFSIGNSTNG